MMHGHGSGVPVKRALNADPVVHRGPDTLFAAEVPLRGLDRNVSEEKRDMPDRLFG
jgi:hypothetical protein